ncbi:hypothetical protein M404DRAFT_764701 [Pisolithus tinctorius Marx 270]|uniref:Uncharacterized protein n=1 Tax=Pisolithus tinctorius Marx 270 TaxID=870435 RepID=A0A0C3NZD8_PISTI|nr:hypothetical protein M404DRAFT_764701 [Pisolithus tinctorius Marx 270]
MQECISSNLPCVSCNLSTVMIAAGSISPQSKIFAPVGCPDDSTCTVNHAWTPNRPSNKFHCYASTTGPLPLWYHVHRTGRGASIRVRHPLPDSSRQLCYA